MITMAGLEIRTWKDSILAACAILGLSLAMTSRPACADFTCDLKANAVGCKSTGWCQNEDSLATPQLLTTTYNKACSDTKYSVLYEKVDGATMNNSCVKKCGNSGKFVTCATVTNSKKDEKLIPVFFPVQAGDVAAFAVAAGATAESKFGASPKSFCQ